MSVEPQYVTKEELDAALKGYERLGASEEYGRVLDAQFRSYFGRLIEQSASSVQTKSELKISEVQNEFFSNLAVLRRELTAAVESGIGVRIDSLKTSLAESVLAQTSQLLQAKSDQLHSFISAHAAAHKQAIDDLDKKLAEAQSDAIKKIAEDCKASSAEISAAIVSTALESYAAQVKQSVDNTLAQTVDLVSDKMKQFEDLLARELSEKTIDRERILKQMRDIELELHVKSQAVIDFQVEQARQMMEQSAKAELRDGLNNAVGLLLGRSNLK